MSGTAAPMPKPNKAGIAATRAGAVATAAPPKVAGAGKHAADPSVTPRAARKDERSDERSDELRFKVTQAFKQRFKQTAKDLGIKKGALLERLLAEWQARHPAEAADGTPGSTAAQPRPTGRRKPRKP